MSRFKKIKAPIELGRSRGKIVLIIHFSGTCVHCGNPMNGIIKLPVDGVRKLLNENNQKEKMAYVS